MEYVIVALMVITIILLIIILSKGNKNSEMTERLGRFETNITKEIGNFKMDFSEYMHKNFNQMNERMEYKLNLINDKVNERIEENFEKTNKTFNSVLERLSKIDEAQKKIDGLGAEIISLQSVLTDKKTRGIFGEVNLTYILTSVFGENNKGIFEIQHKLSNGSIADAMIHAPLPLGNVAIDSKFPLENYERMTNKNNAKEVREIALKQFKLDVKKHIDAIADKYIIYEETANEAIMFLPAEAIFAEINAYHPDLLQYSYKKRVWITSPTTLMSTLTTISMIIKNMERDKYTAVIHQELNRLGLDFQRYKERWDKLSRSIDTVNKDVKDIHITTEKITKRFDSIQSVDLDSTEEKQIEEVVV